MATFLIFSVLTALVWILLYRRIPLWASSIIGAVVLGILTKVCGSCGIGFILLWILFLIIFIPLNLPFLRCMLLTGNIMELFRKMMPPISPTEKEALDAGTVWWDGELFSGRPNWDKLLKISKPVLTKKEKDFLDGPVEKLCNMVDDWKITNELNDLPPEIWTFLKEKGFFGMIIPEEFKGLGFSAYGHSCVVVKIASRSITAAVTVMVPNSLGPAELLLHYGTEEQKNYYLPRLSTGEEVPCFGLTNPEAGSDAGSLPDLGIVCRSDFQDKKDILGIRLNWEKRYITLGPLASLLGLAFKLKDPNHLLGDNEDIGITLALIPTDTQGIEIGSRHSALDIPFQVGPNSGKDVFIPMDWVIGGEKHVGTGWRMLMNCLAAGRSISLPALSAGSSKVAARSVGGYSRIRKQFKMSIGNFEGIKDVLARIAGNNYVIDAARLMTVSGLDSGEKPSVISAIVKYNLTERCRNVIIDAMDIQAGAAICKGPRNFIANLYQSMPISITVEGANILTRSMIVFGQGAIRCHPYIADELKAAAEKDKRQGLKNFDRALFGHIGFVLSNASRALFLGLTNSRFSYTPVTGTVSRYYRSLSRMSSAFTFISDVAMLILGGALKRKESLSARMADVLSNLYLASASLKRFNDNGRLKEELPLLEWACQDALYTIQENLCEFIRNFPNPYIGTIMRLIVFPLGKRFKKPSDTLCHKTADILLNPSSLRDILTEGIFISTDPDDPMRRIENALIQVISAEPAEKKLRQAVRKGILNSDTTDQDIEDAVAKEVITEDEASIIKKASALRKEVIKVDDF